ncbi:fatty acyl-AMP ligase [Streptomyces sp. E11-3]|uniref:fatty acyl-AMP ligase n=1 Tax=Streptomyces sp. E11-3 TaxID=3110112 RepID=UPI00397FD99B
MTGYQSFTELIRARAAQSPDRDALVLLAEDGGQLLPESVSYAELDGAARAVAGRLQRHVPPGERVLILHGSRRQFAIGFLACLYAGVVAVPTAPPDGRGHHDGRVAGIVKDAAASCVLTSAAEAAEVTQLLARTGYEQVLCILTDAPDIAQEAERWSPPDLDGDTAAFLQYTSGSTRDPRGVVVTQGNLLANHEAISQALGTRPGARIGGWLPLHHDMGLIGQLLHALWLGGTAVLLSPSAFVRKPVHWLQAISRYRLTVSGAPDFAYELCVRRVNDAQIAGLDLSCWEIAVDGGEPVRAETLRAFAERFAPAGLRPEALVACYGLAEATLLVTGSEAEPALPHHTMDIAALEGGELREAAPYALGRDLVHSGSAVAGEVRIVDPDTCEELKDGRIGEIWLRGASVARGYWARPAETAATFDGHIVGGEGGYLRTGDLGALREGRLHVTGRIKDMIVVAGRNLYPQDLERTVQQVSALFGSGTAFAVPGERERIVVVQELRARSRYDIDLDELSTVVQKRLSEEYEVSTGGVLLVRPGTVRRTSSGKVQRAAMRQLFLRGELKPLHQRIDPEVERLLATWSRR